MQSKGTAVIWKFTMQVTVVKVSSWYKCCPSATSTNWLGTAQMLPRPLSRCCCLVFLAAVTELGVNLVAVLLVLCLAQAKLLSLIFHYWQCKERSTKVHNLISGHFALCHNVIKRTRELKTEVIRQKLCPQSHHFKAAEDEGGHMN